MQQRRIPMFLKVVIAVLCLGVVADLSEPRPERSVDRGAAAAPGTPRG